MKQFESTHKLEFLCCPWERDAEWTRFKIGTCSGLWRSTPSTYDILAIDNSAPGNGNFIDVLEIFENSCKRDNRSLRFLEVHNLRFKKHLIEKIGFNPVNDDVIKMFD